MHFEFSCLYIFSFFFTYFAIHTIIIIIINRRVHITEETLEHLNGAYHVEEGDGGSRDLLLKGRKTYLVIDPHKPDSISRRPRSVGVHTIVKCMNVVFQIPENLCVSSVQILKFNAPKGHSLDVLIVKYVVVYLWFVLPFANIDLLH